MSEQQKNDVLLSEETIAPEVEIQAEQVPVNIILPGVQLATSRKLKGLSIEDVANSLKLAPRQIIAIEADDYASLPGMAITRGFMRTYAKLLGMDPAPLLEALPKQEMRLGALAGSERVQSRTFHASSLPLRDRNKLIPVAIAVAVAVLVAAGGFYLWHKTDGGAVSPLALFAMDEDANPEETLQAVDGSLEAPQALTDVMVVNAAPEAAKASGDLPKPERLPVADVAVTTSVPVAMTPATIVAASSVKVAETFTSPQNMTVASAPAEVAKPVIKVSNSKDLLRLTLRENAWVEIRRTDGSVVFSRLLLAGSTESFDVPEPLQLVIGNATGVEATLRGVPLDLPLSKNSVARINLK